MESIIERIYFLSCVCLQKKLTSFVPFIEDKIVLVAWIYKRNFSASKIDILVENTNE